MTQPDPPSAKGRLAALDGVRAVAVLGVLAYHGGVSWAAGGMFGVDIFFVLSGFLITSLLLGERTLHGSIALKRFWIRRARRLLPALIVTIIGALALARWGGGDSLSRVRGDALGALLYVSNWHLMFSGQGYFNRYGALSPLLHTWSLGVEEQFYVLWPLIVVAILARRGAATLAWVAGIGAAASATIMAVLDHLGVSQSRLYYGTDTRAQALLVGATLAALMVARPGSSHPARSAVTGYAGAAVLVWMLHAVPGTTHWIYNGGFLLVALCAGAVVSSVVQAPTGAMARALSIRPLTATGRISYGLYLYHWPLFLWLDGARTGLEGWPLLALRLAVTFAVAAVSFVALEQPVRTGVWWTPARPFLTSRAWFAFGSIAVAGGFLAASLPQAAANSLPPVSPEPRPGAVAVRALLVGDSIGLTLGYGLGVNSTHWGVTLDNQAKVGCDLDPETTVDVMGVVSKAAQGCPDWRSSWAALVAQDRPQVVMVVMGRWEEIDRVYQGRWTSVGQAAWDAHLRQELVQAIDILSARGATVVLATLPYIQETTEQPDGAPWDMNLPARTDAYNAVVRQAVAERPGRAVLLDLNRLADPDGKYTSYVKGIRVRNSDDEHFSVQGGEYLQPLILPTIDALGADALARSRPTSG